MVNDLLVPLILTIAIECIAAFLMGYRQKLLFLAIFIVNLVTNPFLNFLVMLINYFKIAGLYFYIVIPMEIIIVFAEWGILYYIFHRDKNKFLFLSFMINLSSYLTGLLLFG